MDQISSNLRRNFCGSHGHFDLVLLGHAPSCRYHRPKFQKWRFHTLGCVVVPPTLFPDPYPLSFSFHPNILFSPLFLMSMFSPYPFIFSSPPPPPPPPHTHTLSPPPFHSLLHFHCRSVSGSFIDNFVDLTICDFILLIEI